MNSFYYLFSMLWLRIKAEVIWRLYGRSNNMKTLLRLNAELEIIEQKMTSLNKRYEQSKDR